MAAYRADIEIGVRGQRELEKLRSLINQTAGAVDTLNKVTSARGNLVQSIENYTKNLDRARQSLSAVTAGSEAETKAIREYVTILGQANGARDRQNKLIEAQIIAQRKVIATANAGFGVQGPALPPTQKGPSSPLRGAANIPGSPIAIQNAARQRNDIISNAVIGGAFPLLFGQGLGASIGGGAGGALGGALGGGFGFGLSLLGTAGGAALDQVVVSAQDFAKSLRQGGDAAGYLEQKLGYLDPTIKKQISNLQSSGQTAAAAEMAFQELAKTVGEDGARAFLQAGKNTDLLSRSLKLLVDRFVAAGFAANKFFEEAKYGKGGSFMDALPAQFRAAPAPQDSATTSAFKERSAQLSRDTDSLRTQLQLTTASAKADLDRFVTLSKTAAQKEYENELAQIAIQLKNKEISLEQNRQLITNANLQLSIKYGEIERQRIQETQRRQEEAARAAKQAAEEAARAAEQASKARLSAERDTYEQLRKGVDLRVREAEFYNGPKAGLLKQQELLRSNYQLQVQSLDVERELAIVEAQKTGTAQKVFELYDLKLAQLNSELNLETDILNRKIAQTRLSEQQAKIDRQRAQIATIRGVSQTNQRLQLETSIAPDSTQLREQLFLLDQSQRVYAELLPEQEKFRDLQREIRSGALDKEALISKQDELDKQQVLVQQLTEELSLRSELEKRQSKLNELYKQYGFIGDEVSAALSNSITGLITGTQTVAEAFSRMFENIGRAFIDMATQMLAQKLIFTVFQSILGASGGGLFSGAGPVSGASAFGAGGPIFNPASFTGGFSLMAEGGFVTAPTRAVVGEGGQPEYVIPASKMRSAMGRYAAGARGASVIPGNGEAVPTQNSDNTATLTPIDVRYSVERINNVDYVTADQFRAGMAQAAQQGASRGEQATLRRLQQSTTARRRIGI